MEISHITTHLGEEDHLNNAVVSPIFQTSNFCFTDVEEMRERLKKESTEPFYTRGVNPTVKVLREKIAALEHAEDALIFASGSAALAAGVMSSVKAGDHIICVEKPYSWTGKLINQLLRNYNVTSTMVDGTNPQNFEDAIRPETKLIVLETPNSITFELQDLKSVADLARSRGITTICDNSYCSPVYQNPIALGIDMVAHSATKYIGGHSDVVAGVLCGTKKRMQQIFSSEFMTLGGIISPHDAWLLIRGLRTLPLRIERSGKSAQKVAEFLHNHPKIKKVNYPFLPSFPQYELARKQMRGCGGLLSVVVDAPDLESMEKFCNSLKYFLLACSWGGFESLQFPQCALADSQNYSQSQLPFNLTRLYIGLEDPELLTEDLDRALSLI